MVVDDHPMWRDAVARDLEAAGLTVVATAASGDEALVRRVVALDQLGEKGRARARTVERACHFRSVHLDLYGRATTILI